MNALRRASGEQSPYWPIVRRDRARRALAAAGAGLLALAILSGCGMRDGIVGIHPAPSEVTGGASLTVDAATRITARVLDEAAAAAAQTGEGSDEARARVMNGSARDMANSAARVGAAPGASEHPVARTEPPKILALSEGRDWPRAILATTLDPSSNIQRLLVLTSASAAEPYVLTASVPMFAGSSLPTLGAPAGGTAFFSPDDGTGLALSPQEALAAYAAALAFPDPVANDKVPTTDTFATGLRASMDKQKEALGDLASITATHTVVPEQTMAFRMADGGAVVFGRFNRLEKVTLAENAQKITLPEAVAKLVGKDTATKGLEVASLETIVLVVPTQGTVSVVGAAEQRDSGTAE